MYAKFLAIYVFRYDILQATAGLIDGSGNKKIDITFETFLNEERANNGYKEACAGIQSIVVRYQVHMTSTSHVQEIFARTLGYLIGEIGKLFCSRPTLTPEDFPLEQV